MTIGAGAAEGWLMLSFGSLAALECIMLIVLGRRSLAMMREQATLRSTLDRLRGKLDIAPGVDRPFAEILADDPTPIACRDGQGRVTYANAAYLRLVTKPTAGASSRSGSGEGPAVIEAAPERLLPDGSRIVEQAISVNGGTRWISWTVRDVRGLHGPSHTWWSGRDITDHVELRQTLESARGAADAADRTRSRFLALISHEFRTPLGGIIGMSDLLLDGAPTPEQASHIRIIRGAAEAFLTLVEEILDVSSLDQGRLPLRPEATDLLQLVEGVAELLAPRAHGKGIDIATFVSPAVTRHVVVDRQRLRQVLLNLAGNAVKFTERGGVAIVVDAAPDGRTRFSVEDTGAGIPADRTEAIFEEFVQGHGAETASAEGTGLGLPIARGLVRAMGGEIELRSTLGEGSAFRFELALAAAPTQERRHNPDCAGRAILVVAEPGPTLALMTRQLEDAGASIRTAGTVEEALAALSRWWHDVLLMDATLGEETLRKVATAAGEANVPLRIVIRSPYETRTIASDALARFEAYLTKPVRRRSLFQQVSRPASTVLPRPLPDAAGDGRRPFLRVLLAEDNDVNALIAVRTLEKIGATVDWARTGTEALALAEQALSGARPPYDAILMDMRLPELDGEEVTRRIRRRESLLGASRGRIVALSASLAAEGGACAMASGLDGFLNKPFKPEELRRAITPIALARAS